MTCTHYWMCGDGVTNVQARCKLCGDMRVFRPSVDDDWSANLTTSEFNRYDRDRTMRSRARGGVVQKQRAAAKRKP